MNKQKQWIGQKSALDLLEEAFFLLRQSKLSVLLTYFIGTLPFVLSFIYYLVNMWANTFAEKNIFQLSFIISILYLWMKSWQSVFIYKLREQIYNRESSCLSPVQLTRLSAIQTIYQPWSFLFLPLSMVFTLPYAYVYSFFHNISFFGNGEEKDIKTVFNKSREQAVLWPGQNHILILITFFFASAVFINICIMIFSVPYLIKTITGIETIFTKSGVNMLLNSTFYLISLGITYIVINPFIKTIYLLRCFYGISLQSGDDLLVELKDYKNNHEDQ